MTTRVAACLLGLALALGPAQIRGEEDPLEAEARSAGTYVFGEFVSVSCPACEDMRPVIEAVLARHPGLRHQVHDADLEVELARKYEVRCVPVYVVVAPDGRVQFNEVGTRTREELETLLREAGVGDR